MGPPGPGMAIGGPGLRSPLMRTSSEVMASEILNDVDPWTAWMYKPQTAAVTLAGAGLVAWAGGVFQTEEQVLDPITNTKRGVWATIAVFLGYCLLQAPSTVLVRPHPAFWRFVHGIAVIYLVILTFLLFQVRSRPFFSSSSRGRLFCSDQSLGLWCSFHVNDYPLFSRFLLLENVCDRLFVLFGNDIT
ncbi:hypothetical protein M758_1G121500 [Ceratodon purpureus]|nr:hypothetical protein M758_1G121500 [Ceratodon purpureus]